MADEVVWTGESGTRYTYYVHSWPTSFTNAEPGNYIFCKLNAQNQWEPIYIGQTGDLSERFDSHHAMDCIDREGATHIHVHLNSSAEETRREEERDLIDSYDPPCYQQ